MCTVGLEVLIAAKWDLNTCRPGEGTTLKFVDEFFELNKNTLDLKAYEKFRGILVANGGTKSCTPIGK